MNLNPTVRWLLGGLAAAVGYLAASDPFGLPPWVQGVIALLSVLFGALGIVPPQVGGTQQGVVNPSVTEPPAAKIDEAGYGVVGVLLAVLVAVLVYLLLVALTGSAIVGIIGAILVMLAGIPVGGYWR